MKEGQGGVGRWEGNGKEGLSGKVDFLGKKGRREKEIKG